MILTVRSLASIVLLAAGAARGRPIREAGLGESRAGDPVSGAYMCRPCEYCASSGSNFPSIRM
jgi:hypothetical protein